MAGVLGEPPLRIGWDVSGVVTAVGAGVTRFQVGDEVFGMPWFPRQAGAYAEYVTAPSRHFAAKPHALSHEEAAALPLAGLTAWQIVVDTIPLEDGADVLIHGAAGGVGHLAVQIAKARGANVIATARAEQAEWLRELGADQVIDYRERALRGPGRRPRRGDRLPRHLRRALAAGTAPRAASSSRSPAASRRSCSTWPPSRAAAPPASWSSPTRSASPASAT